MTSSEKRSNLVEILRAIGWVIFFFVGIRVVYVGALYLGMGQGTATFWLFGWLMLSGLLMPETTREEWPIGLVVCLLFFGVGVLVHVVGWSGN